MADFGGSVSAMEKLNEYNYRDWKSCMKSYLREYDLCEIVAGSETSPPSKEKKDEYKKWDMKAGRALYAIKTTIDKSLLARIEDAKTPKEAWDTLESLFSRKNAARLQLLEKELMNVSQGTMSISEYFLKVKNLCREMEQLDPKSKFGDDRIRRIIIAGLKVEYNAFISAIQGWPVQPSLIDLENLLANQEALLEQMSGMSIRSTEEALYTNSRGGHSQRHGTTRQNNRGGHQRRSIQRGGAQQQRGRGGEQQRPIQQSDDKCYNCGKRGHFARDCRNRRPAHGNTVTHHYHKDDSEEEWDFEAAFVVDDLADQEIDVSDKVSLNNMAVDEVALAATSMDKIDYDKNWIVDSGCSNHMTGDKKKLLGMSKYAGCR
ncbi:unnamed protein product [Rhodiola kirilowii]